VVRDVHRLKKINQEVYPGVPYIILGHSMGSFIVRNYICRYGSGIEGAIVCGTGMQSGVLLTVSKIVAGIQKFIFGDEHVSHFIDKCAFGSYNKKIENPRTSKDWLTKDEEIVDTYLMDSLCGFTFTVNGFSTLFELISRVRKEENLQKIPKELPILVVSGLEDPVGNYGEGVRATYDSMEKVGLKNISMTLYPNDRHEVLNETDRKKVMEDLWNWIFQIIKK